MAVNMIRLCISHQWSDADTGVWTHTRVLRKSCKFISGGTYFTDKTHYIQNICSAHYGTRCVNYFNATSKLVRGIQQPGWLKLKP